MFLDKIAVIYLRNFLRPLLMKLVSDQLDAINRGAQKGVEVNLMANVVAEELIKRFKMTPKKVKKNG